MKPRRLLSIVVAFALAGSPGIATAQDDGVTYDPDSPAGKEYQLPLEAARGTGGTQSRGDGSGDRAGVTSGDSQAGEQSSLFGAGVTQRTPKPSGARRPSSSRPGHARPSGSSRDDANDGEQARVRETARFERAVAASSGANPFMVGGLATGAALLLAIAAALAAHRLRTRHTER